MNFSTIGGIIKNDDWEEKITQKMGMFYME